MKIFVFFQKKNLGKKKKLNMAKHEQMLVRTSRLHFSSKGRYKVHVRKLHGPYR